MKKLLTAILLLTAFLCHGQILYKISGNGLKSPSYIFGTHHAVPLSVLDGIPEFLPALEDCEQVVGEIDMTGDMMGMAMKMQPYMMAPADSTLYNVLGKDKFTSLNEKFTKLSGGQISLEMFNAMRPMAASSYVTIMLITEDFPEFNPEAQLDKYIQEEGKQMGKTISGLETVEQQASLLYTTIPISEQAKTLEETLNDQKKARESAKDLNNAYLGHDLRTLMALSQKNDDNAEFMMMLIDRRNEDWLTKLPAMMAEHPSFIAVGALHLPGEHGVLEGLKALGYEVTPIR